MKITKILAYCMAIALLSTAITSCKNDDDEKIVVEEPTSEVNQVLIIALSDEKHNLGALSTPIAWAELNLKEEILSPDLHLETKNENGKTYIQVKETKQIIAVLSENKLLYPNLRTSKEFEYLHTFDRGHTPYSDADRPKWIPLNKILFNEDYRVLPYKSHKEDKPGYVYSFYSEKYKANVNLYFIKNMYYRKKYSDL
ncbi:hypothetical protein EQP59_08115 [Ornithobacterium rhinotracheale]|uniref:Lipoprotein n=1 Tax=Ornithobacterium rhinotracheale TaxID=28251 RepID=A0A410JT08_ORNRH|nr:hypothetical protein [Ornithobacterium rhinotracheale]QAR31303.1 hypothetical protein EQP59_08115 [Ornithobacterium rhinotracheale]